ncbi:MAG: methylated-DNA--[protein]-cysteine S-methyltransferase [Betaproteobacteria bacterium]|nr:methylated-DNA--[protein]-cysteine S-methyltransferase [Betaproteobacteria bacterium]
MDALFLEFRPTTLGRLSVVAGPRGLRWVSLAENDDVLWQQISRRFPDARWEGRGDGWSHHGQAGAARFPLDQWVRTVERVVEQPARQCAPVPFDISGTPFQHAVWDALQRIPAGAVWTYGQLAAHVGHPGAARAVGSACGANPIPFLIPCHRVVAANGGLGGFGLGLAVKRVLLAREGVAEFS